MSAKENLNSDYLTKPLPWEFALLWHGLHQSLGELQNVTLDEAFHDLEQLLHDNGDALVAQKLGHTPEVWHADETCERKIKIAI